MAEASFSAYVFGFLQGKNSLFWPFLRQKREKGGNKKEDQNWSCFFGRKVHFFPSLKQIFD